MNYTVKFDFTTVSKGGLFRGKSGQADFNVDLTLEEVKADTRALEEFIVSEILIKKHRQKNVVLVDIKEVVQV